MTQPEAMGLSTHQHDILVTDGTLFTFVVLDPAATLTTMVQPACVQRPAADTPSASDKNPGPVGN